MTDFDDNNNNSFHAYKASYIKMPKHSYIQTKTDGLAF